MQAGQFEVGVALAADQLATDLRCGQAAVPAGGAEGGVGLDVVGDEVLDVVEQVRYAGLVFGGFVATALVLAWLMYPLPL